MNRPLITYSVNTLQDPRSCYRSPNDPRGNHHGGVLRATVALSPG